MLYWLKQLIPEPIKVVYHFALAKLAAAFYGNPSSQLIVIGVTGTNGKSSTVNFIAQILTELGETVGYTSTAGFNIAGRDIENRMKMTMPGRFLLQKMLSDMVAAGCSYAVVESSSQGISQYRHLGINYDEVVFTNLTPEHIEAHGGFEKYKAAKGKLFDHLTRRPHKIIDDKRVLKVSVLNADDEHTRYFAEFKADRHVYYGWSQLPGEGYAARELLVDEKGADVSVNNVPCRLALPAKFERYNALAAMAAVASLGYSLTDVLTAAESLHPVAGRFELINQGQSFTVIVDYAYEPYALKALMAAAKAHGARRLIGVHGSAGGGRDLARRPLIGKLAAENEVFVIVTNEDPYDDDPRTIMEQVAQGAREIGKRDGLDLFVIDDRGEAIAKALSLAREGDAVLITGKGSEPVMAVAHGKKIPWDDRQVARAALKRMGYNNT